VLSQAILLTALRLQLASRENVTGQTAAAVIAAIRALQSASDALDAAVLQRTAGGSSCSQATTSPSFGHTCAFAQSLCTLAQGPSATAAAAVGTDGLSWFTPRFAPLRVAADHDGEAVGAKRRRNDDLVGWTLAESVASRKALREAKNRGKQRQQAPAVDAPSKARQEHEAATQLLSSVKSEMDMMGSTLSARDVDQLIRAQRHFSWIAPRWDLPPIAEGTSASPHAFLEKLYVYRDAKRPWPLLPAKSSIDDVLLLPSGDVPNSAAAVGGSATTTLEAVLAVC
jgi:hypothetical protein